MKHLITRKVAAFTMLTLVAAAIAVPTAQAATVSDAAAIHGRWHNVGYNLNGDTRADLPAGFARHKGSVRPTVESTTLIPRTTVNHTEASGFDRTSLAVGTALSMVLAFAVFLGTRMVRGRRLAAS
jgi:hypothetical protein